MKVRENGRKGEETWSTSKPGEIQGMDGAFAEASVAAAARGEGSSGLLPLQESPSRAPALY